MEEASACRRVAGRASGAAEATPAGPCDTRGTVIVRAQRSPGRRSEELLMPGYRERLLAAFLASLPPEGEPS